MSVEIKYKGNTIASANTNITKTIKTSGKYCEADIIVENTPDGGGGLPNVRKFQVATDSTLGTYGGISFPVVSLGRANYFIINPNSTHLNATDRYVRAIMCTVDYNTTVKALCSANRYDNASVLNQVVSSLINGVLTIQGSAVLHMEQTYTLDVYEVTWQ